MIDLHSHILPGLDDGAQNLQESLAIARMAVDSGITAMVATPHCSDDRRQEVYEAWLLLRDALKEDGIPLRLFMGMEIFGTPETARMLYDGQLLTLNSSRYPLIEFSFRSDGEEETRILEDVCKAGFRPVVAHPERYLYVQENPAFIDRWYRMGCLMQVNRGSLVGRFGHHARSMAAELISRGFATAIASDAHGVRMRTPWMADIKKLLAQEFSGAYARMLLRDNPKKIIKNEDIHLGEPKWFQ